MDKRMKVMQIIPVLDVGGIETHRFLIAKYHNPEDYDLSFCCLSNSGTTADNIEKLGYPITYLHEDIKIPNITLLAKLYNLFRKERPDVVHSCAAEANFHAILAAYFARVPIRVAEEVGLPSQSNKAKKVFQLVYSLTSAVIGVSAKVSNYLVAKNKVSSEKVKTIYNPYDIELFNGTRERDKEKNREFNILSVGRLVKEKNHIFLIRSFEKVIKEYPHAKLRIAGDGPLRAELELYIKLNNLQENIMLLGFRDDIPFLLRNSDLFILPSKLEGLGIALIEAMAMGVLVIGTSVGGVPEVILEDKSMGWIVPNGDVVSLVKTIELIMNLPEDEKKTIVYNARKHVKNKFSPYSYMDNLNHFYKGMIQ